MSRMVAAAIRVLFTREIFLLVAKVYIPVLFPLTFFIALLALQVDRWLGFPPLLSPPWHLVAAAGTFGAGFAIWAISYASIVFEGKGSPTPTAGRTQQLVTTGIYALCRYPSVHGKFLGVLAVGLVLRSLSFCLIIAPLLLAGSLVEKAWRQEPQNEAVFGEAWRQYRQAVPFFIPWRILFPHRGTR